jgi:nucleotide-binding universal stress UspA family protein
MLIPLDGSDLAEVSLPYAQELAAMLCLDVACLHVYGIEGNGLARMHRAYVDRVAASTLGWIHDIQRRRGVSCGTEAVKTQGVLATGHPAEEILRYADDNDTGLILMATHGLSGVRRWVLGSVADKVIRASPVPVMLVRAGATEEVMWDELSIKTLIVPLDGSDLAEQALPHVNELTAEGRAEFTNVVLLRACEPPDILADYPESAMPLTWKEHLERAEAHSKQSAMDYLAQVEKRLRRTGINVRSEVRLGSAAEMIIDCAKREKPSLIVMTTHGRSGLSRLAHGSVAAKVVNEAVSPVFLIPPGRLGGDA